MLRTRLWVGAVLIALTAGVLVVDQWLAPWYPFLFVTLLGLALLGCQELVQLLGGSWHLPSWLCYGSVTALIVANWLPHLLPTAGPDPWFWVAGTFAGVVLAAFVAEMAVFQGPGESVVRIALMVWVAAYLGLLPSFLAQVRWLAAGEGVDATQRATLALALTIFVPKCGDIGAYFTGRFLGRHRMTPILSPKKTWEGAAGGLIAAMLAAVGLDRLAPGVLFRGGWLAAVGLGAVLALAGMVGDLAESLIKRDCRQKDASQVIPGFGGVLDVVDAILFAAPVSYWWLH
jgi:phosphatidate cytidylyltransferase